MHIYQMLPCAELCRHQENGDLFLIGELGNATAHLFSSHLLIYSGEGHWHGNWTHRASRHTGRAMSTGSKSHSFAGSGPASSQGKLLLCCWRTNRRSDPPPPWTHIVHRMVAGTTGQAHSRAELWALMTDKSQRRGIGRKAS
jgi:hypothetical protein